MSGDKTPETANPLDRFKDFPEGVQKAVGFIATSLSIADRTMRVSAARHERGSEEYNDLLANASSHEANATAAAYVLDCVFPLSDGRNWINAVPHLPEDFDTEEAAKSSVGPTATS